MKRLLHLGAFAVLVTVSPAQTANPPGQADAASLTKLRTTVDQAKNLALAGKVPETEQALVSLNRAKPNTDAWYMETALRLMQTAEQLARSGQTANVAALANRALQNLTQADTTAKNAGVRAAAKTIAGTIYERYLANTTAALASYEAAAQLAPENAAKAKEAADRLKRIDSNAKDKVAAGGR